MERIAPSAASIGCASLRTAFHARIVYGEGDEEPVASGPVRAKRRATPPAADAVHNILCARPDPKSKAPSVSATSEAPARHQRATPMRPSSHPHATLRPPPCDLHATWNSGPAGFGWWQGPPLSRFRTLLRPGIGVLVAKRALEFLALIRSAPAASYEHTLHSGFPKGLGVLIICAL